MPSTARAGDDQDAARTGRGRRRSDEPAVADAAALHAGLLREAHVFRQPQLNAALASDDALHHREQVAGVRGPQRLAVDQRFEQLAVRIERRGVESVRIVGGVGRVETGLAELGDGRARQVRQQLEPLGIARLAAQREQVTAFEPLRPRRELPVDRTAHIGQAGDAAEPAGHQRLDHRIDLGDAHQVDQHVARGVVAVENHLLQQGTDAHRGAHRPVVGAARAVDVVRRPQGHQRVEREIAALHAPQHRDGDRHLDHRGEVPALGGLVRHGLAGVEVAHVDADAGGMFCIDLRERGGQARRPGGRRRCLCRTEAVEAQREHGSDGQPAAGGKGLQDGSHRLTLLRNTPARALNAPTSLAGRCRRLRRHSRVNQGATCTAPGHAVESCGWLR